MEPQQLRASDEDRDRVAAQLREHYGAGRIDDAELSERLDRVVAARRLGELERLTADLPTGSGSKDVSRVYVTRRGRALRTSVRIHAFWYVLVNAFLIAIWAITGGGYFWPIWPLLGWGLGLAGHAAPVLMGAGTRPYDPERTALERAAAPDGTVTILFTDIEGSTALNDRLGDQDWLALLHRHHAVVREQVGLHRGFEVKEQGDGFMLAFPSARRAVECARGIQHGISAELGGEGVKVRIGLHCGEAIRSDDDFYGRNVALAARIARECRGGEILASAVVRELLAGAGDVTFSDEREVPLAGLAGTHRLYRVS